MLQAQDEITLAADRYRLLAPLGGSAYGIVWRARGSRGADVALKFINRAQMAQAPAALQARWIESAGKEIDFLRTLAPWDERHIVRLLDSGAHDALPVMALELMHTDLARQPRNDGSLARILDWLGHINQALAKVHQYGWLYLDLKPANVLLTADGHARLADFGASRLRSSGAARSYSGTASWQAPEQFFPAPDGSYRTCARTDFFALGALFYYLVTGGAQLRFCQDCGNAYRHAQHAAPAALLARSGGAVPPTLQADEAARFMAALDAMHDGAEPTWCRTGQRGASAPALVLLQSLLSADPAARPRHALHISRMLAAVRKALQPAARRPARTLRAGAWSMA